MKLAFLFLFSIGFAVLGQICTALGDASIEKFTLTRHGQTLSIEATASDPSAWGNTQLLIDADNDLATGFQMSEQPGRGFDFMVEGNTLYAFQGPDQKSWSWKKLGTATRQVTGNSIAMDIDLGTLNSVPGSPKAQAFLRGLSADYQKVLATSPIESVDLSAGSSSAVAEASTQPASDSGTAALNGTWQQDGADLVLKITCKTPADLNTVLIFFDTDSNADTGFLPPADPHFGFEFVLQGGSLLRHTGGTRGAWTWEAVTPVKQSLEGNSESLRFNASFLKSSKFRFSVWQMSPDWQTRTDLFPHDPPSLTDVNLDASKLRSDATLIELPMSARHVDADLPVRERFKRARSYCCYYGADQVASLSHFDAVILHTPAQTAQNVKSLSGLGVVTLGYLSVGEDERLRAGNGRGPGGYASWYFDRAHAGNPERNGTWGSYYANAADPAWREFCLSEARTLCGNEAGDYGFDGIFLDTIETVDAYPQSREGMIELVKELRAALPDKVIVINRGFSLLGERSISSNIDGLMYESFTDSYDLESRSYIRFAPQDMDSTREVMEQSVLPAVKKFGLRVLALDYTQPDQLDRIQEAFDRAATFGMIPGVAPISLDMVYNTTNITSHSDVKYLDAMATPQSLQITMKSDGNGFPAGTIVQPSSCFLGYSVAAVVDGRADRSGMIWSKAAWASAEEPNHAQQVLLEFPRTIAGGTLKITFATDNGQPHPSRHFRVEASGGKTGQWQTLAESNDQNNVIFTCALPQEPFDAIRIVQDPGGGSSDRPNLMWIAQIERIAA